MTTKLGTEVDLEALPSFATFLRLEVGHCMDGCRLLNYLRILLAVVKSLLVLLHDLHFKSRLQFTVVC